MTNHPATGDEPSLSGQHQPQSDDVRLGGDSALLHLVNSLNHSDPVIRKRAAFMLAGRGDERAYEALVRLYHEGERSLRPAVLKALGKLGDRRALDLLVACLEDGTETRSVRVAAAKGLEALGDPRAVDPLLRILEPQTTRPSGWIRDRNGISRVFDPVELLHKEFGYAVIRAVIELQDVRAVPTFLSLLRLRPHWMMPYDIVPEIIEFIRVSLGDALIPSLLELAAEIHEGALFVLAHLRDQRAIPELLTIMYKRLDTAFVPTPLLDTIRGIGGQEAADAFIAYFEQLDPTETTNSLNFDIILALGQFGDVRAVEPLIRWVRHSIYYGQAANALAAIGDKRALIPICEALEHANQENRFQMQVAYISALAQLGKAEVVDVIKPFIFSPVIHVRRATWNALTAIGTPEALEAAQQFYEP